MAIDENTVFLITKDSFLILNHTDELGQSYSYEGTLEENILGVLSSCKCDNCNTPNIVFGLDGIEVVEVEQRNMGPETYFTCDVFEPCGNCKKNSSHEIFLF